MGFYWYLLVIWSVVSTLTLVNASVNIASGKATNQSSDHGSWDSSKAVDGCVRTYVSSNCCTHTAAGQTEAWWQVDLQTQSVIDSVNIIYRDEDVLNRLAGYEIYLSNTSDWTKGTRCHKDNTADLTSMSAKQNVPCPGVARYLTIYNDRREKSKTWYSDVAVLELCEVQVYGCPVGKYGNGNCNNDCINCVNNKCNTRNGTCDECAAGYYKVSGTCSQCPNNCAANNCDSTSGACSDGCSPGFSGLFCRCPVNCRDTTCYTSQCTDCNDGYYGLACIPCPSGCSSDTCDKTSGHCNLCDAVLYGSFCNQSCPSNCKNSVCNKDSGQCADCEDGYFGPFCDACATGCNDPVCEKVSGNCSKCIDGYHGSTCAQTCPTNCNDNLCIKDKGFCTKCVPGLYGSTCDQTCSDNCQDNFCIQGNGLCTRCKQGFHGSTCQQRCPITCKDSTCSQFSGQCEECAVGYHGIQCDKNCPSNCKDRLCNQTNGRCIGCEAEYHSSNCSDSCPDNCKNHICMQENGQCIECVSGFYGSKCVDRCGYCQDGRCDKDTGNCMSSCIDGLTGDRCDVKVVAVNVPSKGDDFKPAAIGIGIGFGVVIVALVIVIIVQARRQHLGRQQNTTRSTTMTDVSLPSIGQELPTEADSTYDVIDAQKSEEGTTKEYPTDDKYERLGQRERDVPHIYETK